MKIPIWPRSTLLAVGIMAAGGVNAEPKNSDILVNIDRAVRSYQDGANVDNPNATQGPAGGTFIYTGKIKHNAGDPVTNSKLYMELPAGAIYQGLTSTPAGLTCSGMPTAGDTVPVGSPSVIVCETGSLEEDGTFKTVSFEVILPRTANDWKAYAYGSIGGDFEDDDPTNNTRADALTRTFTTYDAADLGIEVAASKESGIDTQNDPNYHYTITATNHGPSSIPAGGKAVVTFQIPGGASASGGFDKDQNGWTCDPFGVLAASTHVTCTYAATSAITQSMELPPITVPVVAIMGGDIGFSANVRGYSDGLTEMSDGQLENNSRGVTVTATGSEFTDIALEKTASAQYVDAITGEETIVTYTLKVQRTGGSLNPAGIEVTDTLPAGMVFDNFDSNNDTRWVCDSSISCVWNERNEWVSGLNDQLPDIKYTAIVTGKGTAGEPLVNSASVSTTTAEPNINNNTDTATVVFSNDAALLLDKIGPSRPVAVGEEFNYILTVTNEGPMSILAGQTISLTDTPSSNLLLIGKGANSDTDWSCDSFSPNVGTPVTCRYTVPAGITLAKGQSTTLVLTAKVPNVSTGSGYVTVGNKAVGKGPAERGDVATNEDSANVTVSDQKAGLRINKEVVDLKSSYTSGDEVTYNITVTNDGPQAAQQLKITDALQNLVIQKDNMTPEAYDEVVPGVAGSYVYPGGGLVTYKLLRGHNDSTDKCDTTGSVNSRARTVTCNVAELPVNESVIVQLTIRPRVGDQDDINPSKEYSYINTAKASSAVIAGPEPEASAEIKLTALTDLTVKKTVSPLPSAGVAAGEPAVYTVDVQNLGPSSAYKVELKDFLPENAVMIKVDSVNGGACLTNEKAPEGQQGGIMTCGWGANLEAGKQYTVQYRMRSEGNPLENEVLYNKVEVATTTKETIPKDNNWAEVSIPLKPAELDLQIDMQHTADGLQLGETTRYTITITNNSASDSYASDVRLQNIFPAAGSTATFRWKDGLVISGDGSGVRGGYQSVVQSTYSSDVCIANPALDATKGPLECVIPLMAPGDVITFSFDMEAYSLIAGRSVGTIRHSARVSAKEDEHLTSIPDVFSNNTTGDITSASVNAYGVDFGIDKTASSTSAKAKDNVVYTLQVVNFGLRGSATVTDKLPVGLEFESVLPAGTCSHAAGVVTCPVAGLPKGGHTSFRITTRVSDDYIGGPLVNKACVETPSDENPDNDCSSVEINKPPAPAPVPVDNPLALLAMILGMGWIARRFHMRKHA